MKNIIKTALILGLATSAFAGKYGTAGCGLGSLVFGDQPGMIQIVAATTNNLIVPQTTAITTGTSNCTADGVALENREQDYFAEVNFENLRQEMAQGKGENLEAFASLFGCKTATNKFSATMQKNYSNIFQGSQDGADMLVGVRKVFAEEMSGSCSEL